MNWSWIRDQMSSDAATLAGPTTIAVNSRISAIDVQKKRPAQRRRAIDVRVQPRPTSRESAPARRSVARASARRPRWWRATAAASRDRPAGTPALLDLRQPRCRGGPAEAPVPRRWRQRSTRLWRCTGRREAAGGAIGTRRWSAPLGAGSGTAVRWSAAAVTATGGAGRRRPARPRSASPAAARRQRLGAVRNRGSPPGRCRRRSSLRASSTRSAARGRTGG